jgi:hypothetical protein
VPEEIEKIPELIINNAPIYPHSAKELILSRVKIQMTPLQASFGNYSRWLLVDDRVGWTREVTSTDLQSAINKKAVKLRLYKQKYTDIDLLLVADRTFNSGKLLPAHNLVIQNPGFRRIYFLSYPEAIECVDISY